MNNLKSCLDAEYSDVTFDFSAADILSGFQKRRRKQYAVIFSIAAVLIISVSILNLRTNVVSSFIRSTGQFLSGFFGNDKADFVEYIPTEPKTSTTENTSEAAAVTSPRATKAAKATETPTESPQKPSEPKTEKAVIASAPETTNPAETTQPQPTEPAATEAAKPQSNYTPHTDFEYKFRESEAVITAYKGSNTKISIPPDIHGFPVTAIAGKAFEKTGLTDIELPDTIEVIEKSAFKDSTNLKTLRMSKGILIIESDAFNGCTGLEAIELRNVQEIGAGAFMGCSSLKALTIPVSAKTVEKNAFKNCTALKTLNLNANYSITKSELESSATNTFQGCTALETLNVGKGVKAIPASAFYQCYGLKNVSLPASLRTISDSAFSCCTGLEKLSLPTGVQTIGKWAFYKCRKLSEVSFPETLELIGTEAFYYCDSLTDVTIPTLTTTLKERCLGYYDKCRKYTEKTFALNFDKIISQNVKEIEYSKSNKTYNVYFYNGTSGFTVRCYNGSTAKTYAVNNGFTIVSLGGKPLPTSINLNKYIAELSEGDTLAIICSVENPVGETTYTSSDTEVATVSKDGVVTAIASGTAEITVENNGARRKLVVIVE